MARPRKKFGYDRSTLKPNRRLRFLPTWLTGAGSHRGGSWRKQRASVLSAAGNSSVVDGQAAAEVAHINPWYLWDGENKPGMHANKRSNLIPVGKGDRTIEYTEPPEQKSAKDER